MNDRYFKGFKLDASGDVIGAFPHVDVIQERARDIINTVRMFLLSKRLKLNCCR